MSYPALHYSVLYPAGRYLFVSTDGSDCLDSLQRSVEEWFLRPSCIKKSFVSMLLMPVGDMIESLLRKVYGYFCCRSFLKRVLCKIREMGRCGYGCLHSQRNSLLCGVSFFLIFLFLTPPVPLSPPVPQGRIAPNAFLFSLHFYYDILHEVWRHSLFSFLALEHLGQTFSSNFK